MKGRAAGITLIELLTVLLIVGVLAACALPSYHEARLRSQRADARGALLHLQVLQERHYFQYGHYAASVAELGTDVSVTRSPLGFYELDSQPLAAGQGYLARAVPAADGPQRDDRDCRVLSLDHMGARGAEGVSDAVRRCWR